MSEEDGLIWSYNIDSSGRGQPIGWDELDDGDGEQEENQGSFQSIHLELGGERAQRWLRQQSGLSDLEADALLAEETRPRSTPMGAFAT